MIAFLNGTLVARSESACQVDVNGVGYEVIMAPKDLDQLPVAGQSVTLHTWYMQREDQVTLYGFLSPEKRMLFKLLIGVSGIGPKSALAVLGGFSKDELESVIARQDASALTRLPGIGRKTADRLLLELKDKLEAPGPDASGVRSFVHSESAEVLEALLALGYSTAQARGAVHKVEMAVAERSAAAPLPVSEWLRMALKQL